MGATLTSPTTSAGGAADPALRRRSIADVARSEERYALAIRAANDGIWDWDIAAGTLYLSPRWHAILGRPEPDDGGDLARWAELVHPGDLPRLRAAVRAHLDGRLPHLHVEHRMRHGDGTWRWVLTRGLASRSADGRATRMAGSMSDVTDRRAAEQRLRHDALHDLLTGLPNRTLFLDRAHHAIQRSRRDHRAGCAVLFIDVDQFKLVNDSLGHAIGDKLLVALAGRLEQTLRPGDTVARLGGDEFVLLVEDLVDPGDADLVVERILAALGRPFELDCHRLFATASIGIALSTPEIDAAGLIGNADIAMYHAKRRGRGRSARFDASMRRRLVNRLSRETELRQVVDAAALDIHYQPIVHLATGEIRGMEALARWPQGRGDVEPSEFIPIAEDTGIIAALGQQVLRGALRALARWRADGLIAADVCMSVNLSGRQLDDPGLAGQVRAAIEQADLPPQALKLEITESTLVAEMERTQHVFAEVCASGVGLHLDDFGTGYSSLSALHRFPVDALKIDRSFVAELGGRGSGNEVIIRSTAAMAHSLGLPVIAEGIESVEQLRRVGELGCDFGQGHLFSRAVSAADMRTLLARWRPQDVVTLAAPA